MPLVPDSVYDHTHEYKSENDNVNWSRLMQTGTAEQIKMAWVTRTSEFPSVPDKVIRRAMTNPYMPPRVGYTDEEPTLMDVLSISSERDDWRSIGSN